MNLTVEEIYKHIGRLYLESQVALSGLEEQVKGLREELAGCKAELEKLAKEK